MSKDHSKDDHGKSDAHHGATTIRASKGGGNGGKLVLGAVAAALLLGGGYYAYQNYGAPQNGAQTAYNDTYSSNQYGDDPLRAGPVESSDDAIADTASSNATPPAASERRVASSERRAPARRDAIPEETIGVTPASLTTDDTTNGDDIVVTAAPRPIWVRTPSERRLSSYYPERALERGREGEARLNCTVLNGGSLDCQKTSETPGGFGNAALRVARSLRHASTRADGSNAEGTPVNLRVVFRIDDDTRRG